ncbi:unnamed protein product [Nippostrongylus brasiliensis]|uniref:Ovule protein n=1 Tax=Nippostrongylus brasiliensis TaxID=27835 RepID=A0A0N4YIY2_NIPBR|nr:hypothetical protein Q1695_007281 [Nippostrongylus brasiliensis]VDL80488.1 unnamed protein product [Nippostrongylus brasiliensis]
MGSSMGKYSYCDDMHCMRKRKTEVNNNFSKKYSEYWRGSSLKKVPDTFVIQRNDYSFSTSALYDSPLRENRRTSQFVSSFSKPEKPAPTQFSGGFMPSPQRTK